MFLLTQAKDMKIKEMENGSRVQFTGTITSSEGDVTGEQVHAEDAQ